MDKSLDDIIKSQRGRGRGRGGRGRGQVGGRGGGVRRGGTFGGIHKARAISSFSRSPRTPQGQWQHDRFNVFESGATGGRNLRRTSDGPGTGNSTTKLIVSNLDFGVSDSDVKELFSEFGPLKRAAVHYDKTGRSLGSAEILFERRMDAVRAKKQYDNVPLDGRPMKIEIIGASSATAAAAAGAGIGSRLGTVRGRGGARGSFARGRGSGRGGRGRGGGRQQKESLTAEQLDADLDAYVNKIDA